MTAAVAHRVQTDPLITRWPCEACSDSAAETETGAWYCRRYQSVTRDCDECVAVAEMHEKAVASAEHYANRIRHTPDAVKREAVEMEAGVYEEWATALGAVFDADVFVDRCGLPKAVAA